VASTTLPIISIIGDNQVYEGVAVLLFCQICTWEEYSWIKYRVNIPQNLIYFPSIYAYAHIGLFTYPHIHIYPYITASVRLIGDHDGRFNHPTIE